MAVIYTQSEISKEEAETFEQATIEFVDGIEAMHREELDFWLMGKSINGDNNTSEEKSS